MPFIEFHIERGLSESRKLELLRRTIEVVHEFDRRRSQARERGCSRIPSGEPDGLWTREGPQPG